MNAVLKQSLETKNDTQIEQDILEGKKTLQIEIDGLQKLSENLSTEFSQAVELLKNCTGRIIISGMGKSGHVGRKMAATFASTGTPSFFVHPGEASHGDLGMVTENDVVIALSNSGETKELSDILAFCKRFSIPLIGITSGRESTVAKQADILLLLADSPEACPNGQAPTTSTTMTIALGDALAVALMKRKGWKNTDFKTFHPGGKLGQMLLKVSDLMHGGDKLPLVKQDATMKDALLVMSSKNFGRTGVVNKEGNLVGFVSDGDLRRHMGDDLLDKPVAQVMNPNPRTVAPDILAAEALAIMNEISITDLMVVDGEKPVGLLRLHDIMRAGIA